MNRMNKLAELFGVEIGQWFTLKKVRDIHCNTNDTRFFCFRGDGLRFRDELCSTKGFAPLRTLTALLTGDVEVDRKFPLSPNMGGLLYGDVFYAPSLLLKSGYQMYKWSDSNATCQRLKENGLMFWSKEEAAEAANKMLFACQLAKKEMEKYRLNQPFYDSKADTPNKVDGPGV